MSAIIGFLPPRAGEIRLFARRSKAFTRNHFAKGRGLRAQGRRIFPSLTVQENLAVSRQKRFGVALAWTWSG